MKKFFVGAKEVILDKRGVLLIKHSIGYWDMPGGRLDDDEDLETALAREISEELPGAKLKSVVSQVGAFRVHKDIVDDVSLVLIFFKVDIDLPENLELSDEHAEYKWVKSENNCPEPMDLKLKEIVLKTLSE